MKLDYDCIRDVLLSMEEITSLNDNCLFEAIGFYDIMDSLKKRECDYDFKNVYYSIIKMEEAEYITAFWSNEKLRDIGDLRYFFIYDITIKGHEYLNSVRNPKIWEKIKKSAVSLTLSIIPVIAEKLLLN